MKKILFICFLLMACGKKIPEQKILVTESVSHEILYLQETAPTGKVEDIPAGVSKSEVISQETFSHAGGQIAKITTIRRNKIGAKIEVATNCKNCHTNSIQVNSETPKISWLEKIGIYLLIGFVLYILVRIFPIFKILQKIWSKR